MGCPGAFEQPTFLSSSIRSAMVFVLNVQTCGDLYQVQQKYERDIAHGRDV
jgi:hypothetical protein